MAEDRPVEEEPDMLLRLQAEIKDLRETTLARFSTPQTGTIQQIASTIIPSGAVLMNGATVARSLYPNLVQYAIDNGQIGPGLLFGAGDGSTTFVLPDARGKVLIGAGTLGADTYVHGNTYGAARAALTTAQMPSHDHNVTVSVPTHGNHGHTGSTSDDFSHGGHNAGSSNVTQSGAGVTLPGSYNNNPGLHHHDYGTLGASAGGHTPSVGETTVGGTTAVDRIQPCLALTTIIWT